MPAITVPLAVFISSTLPKRRGRASKLSPFHAELFELRAKGYGHSQMRDWLALNGVQISADAIGAWFERELSRPGVEED